MSTKSSVQEDYGNYLKDYYGIDAETFCPINTDVDTILSRQLDGTQSLHESSSRLDDSRDLLQEARDVLKDKEASQRRRNEAAKMIDTTLMPLVDVVSYVTRGAANVVSPIAGSAYAHAREETERKRQIARSNQKKSAKVAMIEEFVHNKGHSPSPTTSSPSNNSTSKITTRTRKRKALPTSIPEPPPPANGQSYGVGEFCNVMSKHPEGRIRRGVMKKIKSKAYVTASDSALYRAMSAHRTGKKTFRFDEPFPENGRPPLLTSSEIQACAMSLKACPGEEFVQDEVNNMLVKSAIQKGHVPASDHVYNTTTLNNYTSTLARAGGISLANESIAKTNNRWTAERSAMGTMALIIVVAMTHFYVVPEEDVAWREEIRDFDDDTRELYDMVCDFHGGKPVRCRPSHDIFNQDDQTEYITLGKQPKKSSKCGLVATSSLQSSGTHAIYHGEDSNKMSGQRVKRHLIVNGKGDTAPACYSFSGLTEREMPNHTFLVLRIQGLCVGGYGAGQNSGWGYVLFMRGEKGAEERRFKWIRDNILIPFINWTRLEYDKVDIAKLVDEGVPIEEENIAISYGDGDVSALKTIVSEEGIAVYNRNGIVGCKGNPSGTAKEQICDLCKVFPITNHVNKNTTVEHIPRKEHKLKDNIIEALDEHRNDLILKKPGVVIDYLSKQPDTLTQACRRENVVKGLIENGMLDPVNRRMPVFKKLMATNKKVPTIEQYQLYKAAFKPLMHYSYNHGMRLIPDSVYFENGFAYDVDRYKKTKIRDAGIGKEHEQRAKVLTSPAEIESRAHRLELIELEQKRLADKKADKANAKVSADQATVDKLCALKGVESSEDHIANCTIDDLSTLAAPELRKFIIARHPTFKKPSDVAHLKAGSGPSGRNKKQAVSEAKEGKAVNLYSVAFEVRGIKSRLLEVNEEEDMQVDEVAQNDDAPLVITVLLRPDDFPIQPSTILKDPSKVKAMIDIFDPPGEDRYTKVDLNALSEDAKTELLKKADTLFAMLQGRLKHHIRKRVHPSQHSNRCLPWAAKNFAVVAAYMVLFDHLKQSINGHDASQCILRHPQIGNKYLLCTNANLSRFGCYLHHDEKREVFIRSGSAAGDGGIGKRLETHVKKAKAERNDDDSRLYGTYPSKESKRARPGGSMYEDLVLYIGASVGSDVVSKGLLSKDYQHAGGLFLYTKDEARWISKRFPNLVGEQKYMQMVAYLFELGYDLAIGRTNNISDSPGFEGCGLLFIREKKNNM